MWPPVRTTRTPGRIVWSPSIEVHDARVLERHEVVLQVAGAVALVRMRRILPLGGADHVARARETRHERPAVACRRAAEMIEVQVRREHDVDAVGGQPSLGERMVEMPVAVERVDVALLRVHLVAGAAVDDHPAPVGLDDQRPHRQLDPVAVVGRRLRLPQRPRHDAEHRAAVEPEQPVVHAGRAGDRPTAAASTSRVDGAVRRLLQLHEHAVRGGRMDERDQRASAPGRGCSSTSRTPRAFSCASAARMSSTRSVM